MKKQVLIVVLFLISNLIFSQVTNKGIPFSWKNNIETNLQTINLPKINLRKLQEEDVINDNLSKPYRFGFKHNVDFGFSNGKWTTLENGDRIWQIKFQSKNALSLNFIFNEFNLPIGSTLYDDKSDLLGAYTAANNNLNNSLGTWIVKGETIWIEYYEPKNVMNQGLIHINAIFSEHPRYFIR